MEPRYDPGIGRWQDTGDKYETVGKWMVDGYGCKAVKRRMVMKLVYLTVEATTTEAGQQGGHGHWNDAFVRDVVD